MTDQQIQAQRDRSYFTLDDACTQIVALADEALRRGEESARWAKAAGEGVSIEADLRKRIARLEAALDMAASLIANACDGRINWQADAVRWRHGCQDLVKPRAALESAAASVVEPPA